MYAELSPQSQSDIALEDFEKAYEDAASTATLQTPDRGRAHGRTTTSRRPRSRSRPTRSGRSAASSSCRSRTGRSTGRRISSTPASPRARARSPHTGPVASARSSPTTGRHSSSGPASARSVGAAASAVAGSVGTPTKDQAADAHARGVPARDPDRHLRARARLQQPPQRQARRPARRRWPGRGGRRRRRTSLAQTDPVRGKAVRTNIDPELQQTAVEALGSLYGGAAVLDAQTGDVMALSGIAFSAPQPPGSTFKIITATGALDAGIVKTTDTFPVESSNSDIGREIANAHDELCGGNLRRKLRHVVQHRLRPARRRARRREARRHRREASGSTRAQSCSIHRRSRRSARRRARSLMTSPMVSRPASRPSARARCSQRLCRWRASPKPSPTRASACRRPSPTGPTWLPRASRSR